ncbi:MAG: hypothetical protein Q4E24_02890 [bacterium]|nr:hypothetical protein [bacterium]
MYDGHIFCEEYKELKDMLVDFMNGENVDMDLEQFSEHIQELYQDGNMSATQYDDLMRYVQDIMEDMK